MDSSLRSCRREVVAAVDEVLPPFWSRGNPIDLVATVSDGVPEHIIELVAGCDGVDSIITLALIGSPSSGRAGQDATAGGQDGGGERNRRRGGTHTADAAAPAGVFAELNTRERGLLAHIAAVTERTGKPVVSVPLVPVTRCVFPGLGRYAPILLPSPTAAVAALTRATWYATHPVRKRHGLTRLTEEAGPGAPRSRLASG